MSARVCLAFALAILGGCASLPPRAPIATAAEPETYECTASVTGSFGTATGWMDVAPGRESAFHSVQWQSPVRAPGITVSLSLIGDSVDLPSQEWQTSAMLTFRTARRRTGRVRIEIRGAGAPVPLGGFVPPYDGGRRHRLVSGSTGWGDLARQLRSGTGVEIVLVRGDGIVVDRDSLDSALLALPGQAITALRPQLAEMAADPRRRCNVPLYIVVTSRTLRGKAETAP